MSVEIETDVFVDYPYVGNLSLLDPTYEDSGENFLLFYDNEETTFYSTITNSIKLEIGINYNSREGLGSLVGGALVSFGNYDGTTLESNYGIGINSSDEAVNMPRRAISLKLKLIQMKL